MNRALERSSGAEYNINMSRKSPNKKRTAAILIPAAALLLFTLPGFYAGLTVRRYSLESDKISSPLRIALLSDLHSCRYGRGQKNLIRAIQKEAPDLILLAGDIFDDKKDDAKTEELLSGISSLYPCFYVTGNHEYWATEDKYQKKMAILDRYGVHVLHDRMETVEINGSAITVAGLDDPDRALNFHYTRGGSLYEGELPQALAALDRERNPACFSILLSHRPELFPLYRETGFDLVVSGHAHGGQWRLPFLQNGLYSPHEGLFPKYSGGLFSESGTTMIVSRGLARESTPVPRFYNPPELVIIELK